MRSPAPGDPASISAAGAAAARASRDLRQAGDRARTAYTLLKDGWGTSTSVRLRKEGARSLDALAEGARRADAIGSALHTYAGELSELQARARRLVESVELAGLTIDGQRVVLTWGVTGEADPTTAAARDDRRAALQAELDSIAFHHRRRRDRLLAEVADSTQDLAELARGLRLQ